MRGETASENLGEALGHIVLWNERAADLGNLVLVGLAYIEEEEVSPASIRCLYSLTLSWGTPFFTAFSSFVSGTMPQKCS